MPAVRCFVLLLFALLLGISAQQDKDRWLYYQEYPNANCSDAVHSIRGVRSGVCQTDLAFLSSLFAATGDALPANTSSYQAGLTSNNVHSWTISVYSSPVCEEASLLTQTQFKNVFPVDAFASNEGDNNNDDTDHIHCTSAISFGNHSVAFYSVKSITGAALGNVFLRQEGYISGDTGQRKLVSLSLLRGDTCLRSAEGEERQSFSFRCKDVNSMVETAYASPDCRGPSVTNTYDVNSFSPQSFPLIPIPPKTSLLLNTTLTEQPANAPRVTTCVSLPTEEMLSPSHPPTLSPTLSPSQLTTLSPTLSPSQLPTLSPSQLSTLSPSQLPTIAPSHIPTLLPSQLPTLSQPPTLSPSLFPTLLPSPSVHNNSTDKIAISLRTLLVLEVRLTLGGVRWPNGSLLLQDEQLYVSLSHLVCDALSLPRGNCTCVPPHVTVEPEKISLLARTESHVLTNTQTHYSRGKTGKYELRSPALSSIYTHTDTNAPSPSLRRRETMIEAQTESTGAYALLFAAVNATMHGAHVLTNATCNTTSVAASSASSSSVLDALGQVQHRLQTGLSAQTQAWSRFLAETVSPHPQLWDEANTEVKSTEVSPLQIIYPPLSPEEEPKVGDDKCDSVATPNVAPTMMPSGLSLGGEIEPEEKDAKRKKEKLSGSSLLVVSIGASILVGLHIFAFFFFCSNRGRMPKISGAASDAGEEEVSVSVIESLVRRYDRVAVHPEA